MHLESVLFQAFVYLLAAVVAVPLAKRLGLGSVLGYLLAGVAIGPFALGLVGEEGQDVLHFAEFGVVLMLFLVGLELRPALLWRMRGPILGLGGLQVVVTTLAVGGVALALGLDWRPALAVGMVLSLSSTASGLQTLGEKGLLRTAGGEASFAVLLFQDVAVIPMLALLPLLGAGAHAEGGGGHGEGGGWAAELPGWGRALVVLGAVAAVVAASRFLVQPAFRAIARTRLPELFTAAALMLVVGIALLMTAVGLSPALGTFLAGVVLASSEYRHGLEAEIEPFKGLLLGLFFIAVGAGIDFGLVAGQPLSIAGLVLALVALKFAVLMALARGFRLGVDQAFLVSFSLAQGGEFAFVLFSFALGVGALEPAVTGPLTAVVALSMAATPLLMLLNERLVQPRVGTREAAPRAPDATPTESPVIIAGFGRFGHIVGRLLTANGVRPTVLDVDSDQVDLLRRLGLEVYYGDASRPDLLRAAGAEHARVLVVAVDEPEKALEIVRAARQHFPQLAILARARGRMAAYDLLDAGVEHVYRETLDTSLRVGEDVLRALGVRAYRARRSAQAFRAQDEAGVRELAGLRHDRKAYVNRARARIREVERVLLSDLEARDPGQDGAWDTESLRQELAERPE